MPTKIEIVERNAIVGGWKFRPVIGAKCDECAFSGLKIPDTDITRVSENDRFKARVQAPCPSRAKPQRKQCAYPATNAVKVK